MSTQRRFLWRWNLRVLRREWRQYVVILAMMFTAVALSVGGLLVAYNLAPTVQNEFGRGDFAATVNGADQEAQLEQRLAEVGRSYGTVETAEVPVDGAVGEVEVRLLDPQNPITEPMVDLRQGRWPTGPGELAATDQAPVGDPEIGSTVRLAGQSFQVVGVIENPLELSDEFVLATSRDGWNVPASDWSKRYLVEGSPNTSDLDNLNMNVSDASVPPPVVIAIMVNVVSAFAMLLVALLVGAAFAVIAARRTRQYGLLAAAGAPPRTIRAAATTSGLIIGLVATAAGLVLGFAGAVLLLPSMETAVNRRVDFAVPWVSVGLIALMGVGVAALSARWPTRGLSRQPVNAMLSAQRPRRTRVGRAAFVGTPLAVLGALALGTGFRELNELQALAGVLLAPIGLLLMAPLLVAALGRVAAHLPMALRLAGRGLARNNVRSASVVGALALALAVPAGIAVVSASFDARAAAEGPNVEPNAMLLRIPGTSATRTELPANPDVDGMEAALERLADTAPELTLVPIETPVNRHDPGFVTDLPGLGERPAVAPGAVAGRRSTDDCFFDCETQGSGERDEAGNEIIWSVEPAWVASPDLLHAVGMDRDWSDPVAPAIAESADQVVLVSGHRWDADPVVEGAGTWPRNASIPPLLLSPGFVADEGLPTLTIGWLGVTDGPVTPETRAAVLEAVGSDVLVEFHKEVRPQSSLRRNGVLIGLLIGLGVAVATVGLFTAELADDMRLLRSIGAAPAWTRRLGASMAAMLALAGALLGTAIGYVFLLPLLMLKEEGFAFAAPWEILVGFGVLFPLLAAGAAWLLGKRQATDLARTVGV